MAMNIWQGAAVGGGGMYPSSPSRGKSKSLENLSSGFRIDSGPSKADESATREPRTRSATLERAVRNAAQSPIVQSVSQNVFNERNADLVKMRAQGNAPVANGGSGGVSGAGTLDAYA